MWKQEKKAQILVLSMSRSEKEQGNRLISDKNYIMAMYNICACNYV